MRRGWMVGGNYAVSILGWRKKMRTVVNDLSVVDANITFAFAVSPLRRPKGHDRGCRRWTAPEEGEGRVGRARGGRLGGQSRDEAMGEKRTCTRGGRMRSI